ncbi:hypothetical protein GCM10022225_20670 [Plantactinospora mayteni]|uniref:TetR family transcriptional regulator n=1 Tax=Plantactinospora mayteni TaxID=566021 RepID=A0ABQ4ENM0_9ACTN|nr:hypothetical protein [Plantactinospora mayteni]GIG96248.1 hypothetical protein Pma05_28210 [Plantactinospora mayteni]
MTVTEVAGTPVTDRSAYLELIRELARSDAEAYRQRCAELDEQGWSELGLVVGAGFFLAARRRLATFSDQAAIIQFVADTRVALVGTVGDLDPKVAERLIESATTGDISAVEQLDPNLVIEVEMLLLWGLLRPLSDDELSRFLSDVGSLSHQWAADAPTGGVR